MTRRTPAQYKWETLDFDETILADIDGYPRRQSSRDGNRIEYVILHHMAMVGNGSGAANDACVRTWRNREASANYGVDGLHVRQFVWDSMASWNAGDSVANRRSIGIEHANSTGSATWKVSDDTIKTGARLVAHIHKVYKLGRPVLGKTIRLHREFRSTACPGPYLGGSHLDEYVALAQKIYDEITAAQPAPVIDLRNQKLTTDLEDEDGGPLEIMQPRLATYDTERFRRLSPHGPIRMRVYKNGATTPNSTKTRNEFREMKNNGRDKASWSNSSGQRTHSVTMAITHLDKGASLVISQIHGPDDDVVMVRAVGLGNNKFRLDAGLSLGKGKGNDWQPLIGSYQMGIKFKLTIYATKEGILVRINNSTEHQQKWSKVGSGWYWKAGEYLQSGDWAEIMLYALSQTYKAA